MQINTRFSVGDRVWKIELAYVYKDVPCPTCNETGKVVIGDESFVCPKCNGRKLDKRGCYKWVSSIRGGKVVSVSASGHQIRVQEKDGGEIKLFTRRANGAYRSAGHGTWRLSHGAREERNPSY